LKRILLLLVPLALIGATFIATGVSLIPPSLVLGPCLKDWTSPVSYRPRVSRLEGIRFRVADAEVQLCYGRPIARGRTIFGGLVPWGEPWRLGANEPTRLSVSKPVTLAGIPLPAGRYSLYVIPEPGKWTLLVSRSTLHWGNDISPAVRSREIGQATIPVEILPEVVDTFTARVEDHGSGDRVALAFEWERTRVTLELGRSAIPSNLGVLP
jgi:Protein of unknown function (DUF2911)